MTCVRLILFHVIVMRMVTVMNVLPTKIRDEEERMDDETNRIREGARR